MASFSWLYIGLGVILGFLFLGIVAELYYLLWRKNKRLINSTHLQDDDDDDDDDDDYNNKGPLHQINTTREIIPRNYPLGGLDLELGCSEDSLLKTADQQDEDDDEEDLELMGIYNLAGQPRFLFTIKEETKEDLESEDAKSRGDRSRKGSRNRSLSDIITSIETQTQNQTPFFTPMASPPLKASPLTISNFDSYSYKLHGFNNPLFESSSSPESLEMNLNRLRSSPPPKFKFLRDAEEKLYRKLMEEAQRRAAQLKQRDQGPVPVPVPVPVINNAKNEQIRKPINQRFHYSSTSSQVLPLVSSPPEFHTIPHNKLNAFS